MDNKYHKFVLDHLSEINPSLFFDHFKFKYAKKSIAEQLLSNSLTYLLRYSNGSIRSLAQEKMKDLKLQIEAILHKDTIHHSNAVSNLTRNKITALSKRPNIDVSEDLNNSFIEPVFPTPDTSVSEDLNNNSFIEPALPIPDIDVSKDLKNNSIIEPTVLSTPDINVSEDLKNNPFIEPTILLIPNIDGSKDLENNPFDEPVVLLTTPLSNTDSEDLEHNCLKPTDPPTTPTIPSNTLPLPARQNIFKRSNNTIHNNLLNEHDIYEMNYEMDWSPWRFDIIINDVNIKHVLLDLYEKCQKTRPKIKTSFEYGIINLNDGIISRALSQLVMSYFEMKMQEYKPKKVLSVEVVKMLKLFNVTSLEDLRRALTEAKIDYCNLDRDIVYLHRLFEKLGEVESFVQKLLDKKSRKKKKYDGILSFSRQFEFIYVETATTSVHSKADKDLSKLHQAIILMYKHLVSVLPEKLLHELSSMPVLYVQFSGQNFWVGHEL
ncbi:hypothetical protein C2G38_2043802 [Gigaspora rosea]|uniref:Uncharacterized protein n=1 Tax=Gigaspora rosea TaxID=44941 RepID=A0A397UKS2_9GLOM|nr:hypothetical protein C2G38_2043802 [Gigaspora rosea]